MKIISREEAVEKLENNGCRFAGKSTIVLAVSRGGTRQLEVALVGSAMENRRRYMVYERIIKGRPNEAVGMFEKSNMLAPDEMKHSGKIQSIVLGMYGDYRERMDSILVSMNNIEDGRVLDISSDMECDKMTVREIIEALKKWILENPEDKAIVQVEINKKIELGFYPGESFEKIFKMIAPDNNLKLFKSCCKIEGFFKTNGERSRYTYKIEKGKAERAELETNQVFILNLDNDRDFVKRFLAAKTESHTYQGGERDGKTAA